MRCVRGVVAAAVLAAEATLRAAGASAGAAELTAPHHLDRYLLFSGYDLWRNGGFGHGGVVWSPGGLEREGFTGIR